MENLIQWVLRSYGGLFSDYVFIDERRLATLSGLTTDQVYHSLLDLSIRHIVHYIPHKKTPYITFTCKRIESDRIVLNPEIYERRKENLEKRIKAMVEYATEEDVCRSRFLLNYFGENQPHNCLRCDVCLSKDGDLRKGEAEEISRRILDVLSDGAHHDLRTFLFPEFAPDKIKAVVRRMIQEEQIHLKDGSAYIIPH